MSGVNRITDRDIYVLAVPKGAEWYYFFWEDSTADQLMNVLGRFADHPELSFTVDDAEDARQQIREDAARRSTGKES